MHTQRTVRGWLVLASMSTLPLGACSNGDTGKANERNPITNGEATDGGTGSLPADGATDGSTGKPAPDPVVIDGMPEQPMTTLTCDTSVPTTASCGGSECPAPAGIAAMLCTVPCCSQDRCGTANTSAEMPRGCTASPRPDPTCPSATVMDSIELPGCCTVEGLCGVISTLSNTCITRSMFIMLPDNPQACKTGSGGTPDAGSTASGG